MTTTTPAPGQRSDGAAVELSRADTTALSTPTDRSTHSGPINSQQQPTSSKRSPGKRAAATLALVGLLGLGGYGAYRQFGGTSASESATAAAATDGSVLTETFATEAIVIKDLVETTRLSGTVGYEAAIVVPTRATGSVSQPPKAGTAVTRGDVLFRIDGTPTVALYGESAAWRDLRSGAAADVDIRQLEENLSALGYDPDEQLVVDNSWDAGTTAAVKRWQRDLGITDDGVVALSNLVFLPGPGEITGVDGTRGMGVVDGTPMLRYQVHVDTDTVVTFRDGNVSELAPVGSEIAAGAALVSVNTKQTYALLADDVTNTRTLRSGVADGNDIRALEENLVAMGYDPDGEVTVDREWEDATTEAVERWETSLGLDESGETTPELFQFVEPDSTITAHLVEVGDALDGSAAALEIGRTQRRIDASISAQDQDLVTVGDTVGITLPGGGITDGVISEIATSATTGADGDPMIAFRIDSSAPEAFGDLVAAPVRVQVESKRTDAVLSVPTAALIGLVGGGHAVEVVADDGTRQLYAVELGAVADGWIEITAGSVTEGQQVVVPR